MMPIIGVALWCCTGATLANDDPKPGVRAADRLKNPPAGWSVVESVVAPENQLAGFSRNLGGQVVRISNTTFSVGGHQIKVNLIDCKTDEDATKVRQALLRVHKGNHAACPQEGNTAVEFVCKDPRLIERAYKELGFTPPSVTYSVSFRAAPIEKCDYMVWNKMYSAFLMPESNEALIRELSRSFTFSNQIRVRSRGLGNGLSSFSFTPKPQEATFEADGEITNYSFVGLPQRFGMPATAANATITSVAFATTPSERKAGPELLGPNEFWPSTEVEVVELAKEITQGRVTHEDKVAAILEWLMPAKNMRFSGEVTGSRYGVRKVLSQRYGHCWDFSDCFVTLCRASGVPTRQVLGWLYGQSGHVWAEVLIAGKGWRQVDPTAGMGCDSRYVPFVASEDGRMTLVYLSPVQITPKEGPAPAASAAASK
jgi:transglutaminase-like putative cysteine protease